MHPDLKTLIELQKADNSISTLTLRIDASPLEIEALKKQLDDFIHIHEERKARLAANQKERRDLDAEVQAIRAKIARHKDQLYQVKTNEQYRAMQKEVDGEEGNLRKAEDRILEMMVEAEQIDNHIHEAASRLQGEKSRVEEETRRIDASRRLDEAERSGLLERRKALTGALGYEVLAHYDRLRRGRHGIALAEVRDGFCGGCHVLLRPQAYNEIRTDDVYMTCEACARILYYVAPAESAAAAEADPDPGPQAAAGS
ncbi:MAG: zinc ribbon domain-containing protein [Terriglobia bacterium]